MPCNIDGCQWTFKIFKTFTKHLYQFHMISHTTPVATTTEPSLYEMNNFERESSTTSEDELTNGDSESTTSGDSIGDETCHSSNDDMDFETIETENSMVDLEIQYFVAKWILKTRETYKLTQNATEGIIQDISTLTQFLLVRVHMHVKEALLKVEVQSHEVPGLDLIFNPESHFGNPFQGLETFHLQTKYYKEHFVLFVSISIVGSITFAYKIFRSPDQ